MDSASSKRGSAVCRRFRALLPVFVLAAVLFGAHARADAQCISLTTPGAAYTQNFDTLANTGLTNPLTIPGWFLAESGGGPGDNDQYAADNGGNMTGDVYSYGGNGSTDRALGTLRSNSLVPIIGACFTNNTGLSLQGLVIAYTGEQWRLGAAGRTDRLNFEYSLDATSLLTGSWTGVPALNFVTPDTVGPGPKDGNAPGARTPRASSIALPPFPNGATFWIRWTDESIAGNDDGLAVDDFSLTPHAGIPPPNLTVTDVSQNEGHAGTTTFTFTVNLSAPPQAAVTFNITTVDGTATQPSDYTQKTVLGASIPFGSTTFTFDVLVNGNTTPGPDKTFFVRVTNVTGAVPADPEGLGTIVNDDFQRIHDVQGNGAATPIPGAVVTVEGVVTANFQGTGRLRGFFLQEEDADADADPATSEGIFVFCDACPTPVAEGQRVRVTGTVSEVNGMTQIAATTAPSVVITDAGNNLGQVTPVPIALPIVGDINAFYERLEGMLVTFPDTLAVADHAELGRFGHLALFLGGRSLVFTETNPPSVAGNAAYLDLMARRRVILDDDNDAEAGYLLQPDGSQFIYHPRANGGLSVGTQGVDFFRGGDLVNGLTGVLHWSSPGAGPETWRIRPTNARPVTFTVANPRPGTQPGVGGAIKAAGVSLQNYFTTLPPALCGPSGAQPCLGADSVAELNRQRERVSIVVCGLGADVVAFTELENTTPSDTITDLLGAINARCGGAHPYTFVNTNGTLGLDVVRVQQIYRTGVLSPVGSPLVDFDPFHDRPPTAQTFDVVDAANPAFGRRFTVVAVDFKARLCDAGATGPDADVGDGQACYAGRRTDQATRLLNWISGTVVPAAGDPDVLLLGDFHAYPAEVAIAALKAGGYVDLTGVILVQPYASVDAGLLGHTNYAFASFSLFPRVTGAGPWHINADEISLFDYNDEIKDASEATGEEKPDGSSLVPPRVVFQPASRYRAADRDPVLTGLFQVADLAITKVDSPDPVTAGTNLTYTITVSNNGPNAAAHAIWSDTLPAGTTFVSMPAVLGWSCAVGGTGSSVFCLSGSFAVGSAVFTLTVAVDPSVAAGTVLSNTAQVGSDTGEGNPGDESATATTTVAASADMSVAKVDTPDPVTAGNDIAYTITVTNAGPSHAASVSLKDTLPAGTTFQSLSSPGGWSCTTPSVGGGGEVSCSIASLGVGSAVFTLTVKVDASVASGTMLSNTATVSSLATSDPNFGNENSTATTTVAASADLSVTKVDTPDPVTAGNDLTYTITVTNAGPSTAASVSLKDTLPVGTTFRSLSSPGGWSCTTPAVGAGGDVSCSAASLGVGSAVFTLVVKVATSAAGTVLSNTATVSSLATADPTPGNENGTATTTVTASADLSVTKVDTPDPVLAGNDVTYTITVTNAGPNSAASVSLKDTLPAGTTFQSLSSPGGWSCTTPGVGAGGDVSCSAASLGVGSAAFTLAVKVGASVAAGTVLSNTATVSSLATSDPNFGNESATAATTVAASADLSVTKVDTPDPVAAGSDVTYTITVTNAGPSQAASVTLKDTLPVGTTFQSLASPGGWSCTTPAVGAGGDVSCSTASLGVGSAVFTLTVKVGASVAAGTVLSNTATVSSTTTDPGPGNESGTATTTVTVTPVVDLRILKSHVGNFIQGQIGVAYTIVVTNGGSAPTHGLVTVADVLPAGLTATALAGGGWTCTLAPLRCTRSDALAGGSSYPAITLTVNVADSALALLTNTATVSGGGDANTANNVATDPTVVVSPTFVDVPADHPFLEVIEALVHAGITRGCALNPPRYCPDAAVTRAELAVFLLRGLFGASHQPQPATAIFADVPLDHPMADWIAELARERITVGCSSTPFRYCPDISVTRAQAAVFLLRIRHGVDYEPPAATGGMFADVTAATPLASWIEQLGREGLTAGCAASPARYCPDGALTRAEMAALLVRVFNLPL